MWMAPVSRMNLGLGPRKPQSGKGVKRHRRRRGQRLGYGMLSLLPPCTPRHRRRRTQPGDTSSAWCHGCQLDATPGPPIAGPTSCDAVGCRVDAHLAIQGDMMSMWEKTSYQCSGHSRGSRERSLRADSRLGAFPLISRDRAKAHTRRARPNCSFRRGSRRRRAVSSRGSKADRTSFRTAARMKLVVRRSANCPNSRLRAGQGDLQSTPTKEREQWRDFRTPSGRSRRLVTPVMRIW